MGVVVWAESPDPLWGLSPVTLSLKVLHLQYSAARQCPCLQW